MIPNAKAVYGFHQVIVKDCPYCHKEHTHSADATGQRMADCLQGEYILDFSDDLPAGSFKVGAPDEIRQTLDDLWASLDTPRAISAERSE